MDLRTNGVVELGKLSVRRDGRMGRGCVGVGENGTVAQKKGRDTSSDAAKDRGERVLVWVRSEVR